MNSMTIRGKVIFLFLELLGLFSGLSLVAVFIKWFLEILGIGGFPNALMYWALYGMAAAVFAYTIRRIKGGWNWGDLGFKVYKSWRTDFWYAILIYGLLYIVTIPVTIAVLPSVTQRVTSNMGSLLQMSLPMLILISAVGSMLTGFLTGAWHEEILYRGYMQGLFGNEIAPAVGFFLSLIPFSLGHYFAHPDWNLLAVLNTFPAGIAFCLSYYATGSLIVPMVVHTMANFVIPAFALPLYAKGFHTTSYVVLGLLWIGFFVLCVIGRDKVKEFGLKTKELFIRSGWWMSLLGILLGIFVLIFGWGRNVLRTRVEKPIYIITLGVFCALTLGISFFGKADKKVSKLK